MVFYVFLDPDIITAAEAGGDYALQCLVGIMKGFEANCFLIVFEDYFVQQALKDHLKSLQDDNARKELKSLIATAEKRQKFIYILKSNENTVDRCQEALEQADRAELDFLLSERTSTLKNPHAVQMSDLRGYNTTNFEKERSATATGGRTFGAGLYSDVQFLDWTLRRALRHANQITIYDRLFGEKFGGNFEYSFKKLLGWLELFIETPDRVRITIHCGKPPGQSDHFVQTRLRSFGRGRLTNVPITIQYYETASGAESLPHQRFLVTDQLVIDLGRGLDFLDPQTGRNRDGKFGFATRAEFEKSIKAISSPSLPPVVV